jgi:hypothetical protein
MSSVLKLLAIASQVLRVLRRANDWLCHLPCLATVTKRWLFLISISCIILITLGVISLRLRTGSGACILVRNSFCGQLAATRTLHLSGVVICFVP